MLADVARCRQCHIRVGHGRNCGGSRENRKSLHHLFPFKNYFHFRFRGRHCRLPMSDNVFSVIFESGVVDNVAPAYRIASLSLSIQTLCVHACLASAILKFACHSTYNVTNFTHLWVFSSSVGYCVDNCFEQRQCF